MSRHKIGEDYSKALTQLQSAVSENIESDLEKAGCIQYFEFCFELAWKTIKAYLEESGVVCVSPKSCLKGAYKQGWIVKEQVWLDMLMARNRMSHTYSISEAMTVFDSIPGYLDELILLNKKFSELD